VLVVLMLTVMQDIKTRKTFLINLIPGAFIITVLGWFLWSMGKELVNSIKQLS
jgi:hypothetical protein